VHEEGREEVPRRVETQAGVGVYGPGRPQDAGVTCPGSTRATAKRGRAKQTRSLLIPGGGAEREEDEGQMAG
jgi:hypothetical protein